MKLKTYVQRRQTDGATPAEVVFLRSEVSQQAKNNITLKLLGIEENPLVEYSETFLHRMLISRIVASKELYDILWASHCLEAQELWDNLQAFQYWYKNKEHPCSFQMCELLYQYPDLKVPTDLYFEENTTKYDVVNRLYNNPLTL